MTAPLTLQTDRLILRRPDARDVDAIMGFYMTDRAAYVGGKSDTYGAWTKFTETMGHWAYAGYGFWAVTLRDDDRIIGLVGAHHPPHWPEPEVGWLLFDGAEGRGFAEEAARAVLADLQARTDWTTVVHYIAPDNAASIRLAERLGAVLDADAPPPEPGLICHVYRSRWGAS